MNATPVPEDAPLFPNTIWTTLTAVPRSSGIRWARRYTCARGVSQDSKTALTARPSCSRASCGNAEPVSSS